ncbi:hypothetical protein [Monaibacterium marinum]|nr:hypothetical protein [Monaibacterium marinum]
MRRMYTVTAGSPHLHNNGLLDCNADHQHPDRLSPQSTPYRNNGTPLDISSETLACPVMTGNHGPSAFQTLAASNYRIELDTTDRNIPPSFAIGTAIPISGKAIADGVELISIPSTIAA